MEKKRYYQIILVIIVFLFMNLFPFHVVLGNSNGSTSPTSDLTMEFFPKKPQNVSLLNTDTTLTLEVHNNGSKVENFKLDVNNISENLFMNGRDGLTYPLKDKIKPRENKYYSFALEPKNPIDNHHQIEAVLTYDNKILQKNFTLGIKRPKIDSEEIGEIIENKGINSESEIYLIPRYRRYWHPKRDSIDVTTPSYVWVVDGDQNFLIDGESGDILKEDFVLPWEVSSKYKTKAMLWNGVYFENKSVPTVRVVGDRSFQREGGEVYLANRDGNLVWVSRRIFYWTLEKPESGQMDETPDTERVELWFSLDNGESFLTISDYHHHAFSYKPVKEYKIQEYYHCPIPSSLPLQWTTFALVDYKNVYPNSSVPYDHLGFGKEVHPISRVLIEKRGLIIKNTIALILAILILSGPIAWRKWKNE